MGILLAPRSLHVRRGWVRQDSWLFGYYRTRFGSFEGKVRLRMFQRGDFFIRDPPRSLSLHSHWACFHLKGDGWYELHFDRPPESIDDGIKTIERIIIEGFRLEAKRG